MTGRFSVLEVSVPYRLQRERAAPHPAEVQARPLAPGRPASVLGEVVDELQRTAGNGQSESLAHYTPTHPNEHATHAVGMQLGENLPESITSAPGAGLNLSSMKSVENAIRKTAERAAESGGVVETQTITMIEYVGAEQVPTMVGVERKAWLRMAGSDQPVRFVDFKASVDPVTRQVTVLRNEIGGGRVPAAR